MIVMKEEKQVREMLDEMHTKLLDPKSNTKTQMKALHWFHCLSWILEDDKYYIQNRLEKLDAVR